MKDLITLVFVGAVIAFFVIAGPLLTIWALNTLFPILAIEYTIYTWLAALILGGLFSPRIKVKKD